MKTRARGIAFLSAILCFLPVCTGCGEKSPYAYSTRTNRETLRIGVNRSLKSAPVMLAQSLGYFEEGNIEAVVTVEPSAVNLMNRLSSGEFDFVTVPEYQIVSHAKQRSDFRVIAVLNRNQSRILLLNRETCPTPRDLGGKQVGLVTGSAAEYTLYRILVFNEIEPGSVKTVYYAAEDLPRAAASGKLDALILWPPFADAALDLSPDRFIPVNAHMGQDMYWLLVCRSGLADLKPDLVRDMLVSLERANLYVQEYKEDSLSLLSDSLLIPKEDLREEWDMYYFSLEMPQSLYMALEEQAKWLLRDTGQGGIPPEFMDFLDGTPLSAIAPEQVTLIQ